MGEQVQLNIYLPKHKRQKYISVFNKLLEKYSIAMETLFSNPEESAKKYRDKLYEDYKFAYNYEEVDPSDIMEVIETQAYEFYEAEKLMQYNFQLSLLATTYQLFEQQLRGFIFSELNHSTSPVRTDKDFPDFGRDIGKIKEVYKQVGYDLTGTFQWETVSTLADLVNTYKHGEGNSAKRLHKNHPDFFLKAYFGEERIMDVELTTNGEIVFDLEEVGFDKYPNAIIKFWEEFPEQLTPIVTVEE